MIYLEMELFALVNLLDMSLIICDLFHYFNFIIFSALYISHNNICIKWISWFIVYLCCINYRVKLCIYIYAQLIELYMLYKVKYLTGAH